MQLCKQCKPCNLQYNFFDGKWPPPFVTFGKFIRFDSFIRPYVVSLGQHNPKLIFNIFGNWCWLTLIGAPCGSVARNEQFLENVSLTWIRQTIFKFNPKRLKQLIMIMKIMVMTMICQSGGSMIVCFAYKISAEATISWLIICEHFSIFYLQHRVSSSS